jgi:hypothetical protein
MVAPASVWSVIAMAIEAVLVYSGSLVSNLSFLMVFSFNFLSLKTTTRMLFSKSLGFLSSIKAPFLPSLFSGFFLASSSSLASLWYSSSDGITLAPSSATSFAAPGASISRSISLDFSVSSCCLSYERPSSLTEVECFSLSALLSLETSSIPSSCLPAETESS